MATVVTITVTIPELPAAAMDQSTAQRLANEAGRLINNALGSNSTQRTAKVVVS